MLILLIVIVLLCALYLLLLLPRRNHPGWEKLDGVSFAHRGLHNREKGIPENSLTAFRLAVEHGYGAELDVHLLKDGRLAVFHDSTLKRICGTEGRIEELTAAELTEYSLLGTEETIPLFEDVLSVFDGKTPLVIELKSVNGNHAALTDAVMTALKNYHVTYCIESFQPEVIFYLKKHYPEVIRGQLSENFFKGSRLPFFKKFVMTYLLTTFFTRPDFIAYNHKHRSNISLRLMCSLYGVHEVGWTIREQDMMTQLQKSGVTPIFENFIP